MIYVIKLSKRPEAPTTQHEQADGKQRARQAAAVARAREALERAGVTLASGDALDLIAPELLAAVAALGEITGAVATEALLDGIFARFCIGK